MQFEKENIVMAYKVGVLYVKAGQTEEDDMYSNTTTSKATCIPSTTSSFVADVVAIHCD